LAALLFLPTLGAVAFPLLEKHAGDKDAEVASACKNILETLDARELLKAGAAEQPGAPAVRLEGGR
jgi:hypothetical protein